MRADGDGLSGAIALALDDAEIRPAEVGMIVAHGRGTRQSDASEAAAICRVFGATVPPITAFKWAFGHPLAASGILDSVLALVALRHGVVPVSRPCASWIPTSGTYRCPYGHRRPAVMWRLS